MSILHTLCHDSSTSRNSSTVLGGQHGFTLIEMLVVLSIIGVLVAIASPNIQNMLERQRNKELTDTLITAFREARAESLLRHQDVTINIDADENQVVLCTPISGATTGTPLADCPLETTSEAEVLRRFSFPKKTSVSGSSTLIFTSNKRVTDGLGQGISTVNHQTLCGGQAGKQGRIITVDSIGNVRLDERGLKC